MIEVVVPRDLQPSQQPMVYEAAGIMLDTMASVLPSTEVTQVRLMDRGETESLEAAIKKGQGQLDMEEFLIYQRAARIEFGIGPEHKTMTVVTGPTKSTVNGNTLHPFGLSHRQDADNGTPIGEAITSVYEIVSAAGPSLRPMASLLIAFTGAHESGHLYGLVSPRAERHTTESHCRNMCTMNTLPSIRHTAAMITEMGNKLCFCGDCTYDLQHRADERA